MLFRSMTWMICFVMALLASGQVFAFKLVDVPALENGVSLILMETDEKTEFHAKIRSALAERGWDVIEAETVSYAFDEMDFSGFSFHAVPEDKGMATCFAVVGHRAVNDALRYFPEDTPRQLVENVLLSHEVGHCVRGIVKHKDEFTKERLVSEVFADIHAINSCQKALEPMLMRRISDLMWSALSPEKTQVAYWTSPFLEMWSGKGVVAVEKALKNLTADDLRKMQLSLFLYRKALLDTSEGTLERELSFRKATEALPKMLKNYAPSESFMKKTSIRAYGFEVPWEGALTRTRSSKREPATVINQN